MSWHERLNLFQLDSLYKLTNMKSNYFFSIILLSIFSQCSIAQTVDWQWLKGAQKNADSEGWSSAIDPAGNVYVSGNFVADSVSFGPVTLQGDSIGMMQVFLVKYSPSGTMLWARGSTGNNTTSSSSLTIDALGNVYITGYTHAYVDSLVFDSVVVHYPSLNGAEYGYVVKYDGNGNAKWAKITQAGSIYFNGIAADPAGNIYIAGMFMGDSLVFGTDTLRNSLGTQYSRFNLVVVKCSPSGQVIWMRTAGEAVPRRGWGSSEGDCIAYDNANGVVVSGTYTFDSLRFGNYTVYPYRSGTNVYVADFDSAGNVRWAEGLASPHLSPQTLAVDVHGNAYLTGFFVDSFIFAGTTLHTLHVATSIQSTPYNYFLAKFGSGGVPVWAKGIQASTLSGVERGYGLAPDSWGNVYVSGSFHDSVTIGNIAMTQPYIDSLITFSDPMFIVKYDSNGNVLCATSLISGGDDNSAIVADGNGDAYISGDFLRTVSLAGDSVIVGTDGLEVMFVAKFSCGKTANGIASITTAPSLSLYPNPFGGMATVRYDLMQETPNATLTISDILGRIRSSYTLTGLQGEVNISASGMSSGVYFYSLMSEGKMLVTQKMVVE